MTCAIALVAHVFDSTFVEQPIASVRRVRYYPDVLFGSARTFLPPYMLAAQGGNQEHGPEGVSPPYRAFCILGLGKIQATVNLAEIQGSLREDTHSASLAARICI